MRTPLLDYSQYPQVSGELFRRVQEARLFDDGKTFVDAEPLVAPDVVRERYLAARGDPTFDLRDFVEDHFRLPDTTAPSVDLGTGGPFDAYVDDFWNTFAREFDADPTVGGTLVSLPNPHVVPGGRLFRTVCLAPAVTLPLAPFCPRGPPARRLPPPTARAKLLHQRGVAQLG